MEVQTVDVDDVGRVLESFVNVAVFEDAVPDFVGAGILHGECSYR